MRAVVVPVVLMLGLAGYLVGAGALDAHTASEAASPAMPTVANPWKPGYSRRFPGCVASVLWPSHEMPAALVVRWRSGDLARIDVRQASQQVFNRMRTGDAEVLGACYRR